MFMWDSDPQIEDIMTIRDVNLIQGMNVAQIDITYNISYKLRVSHEHCLSEIKKECDTEKQEQKLTHLAQCFKEGIYRRRLSAEDSDADEDFNRLEEKCQGESNSFEEPKCPSAEVKYDVCMTKQTAQDTNQFDEEGVGRLTFTLMKSHDQVHQKIQMPRLPLE